MTYYDRLNEFFRRIEIEPLPPSAQLVYLHLLHENNRAGNPNRFRCTDTRLVGMTGLSANTITSAKRALKNRGYLNFKTNKDARREGTIYELPENAELRVKKAGQKAEPTGVGVSDEIKAAWKRNNDGAPPNETEMFYLADDVKLYGEEKVLQAIARAGQKKRGNLSIYFLRMILGDVISGKEAKANAKRATRISEQYQFGVDEAPDC